MSVKNVKLDGNSVPLRQFDLDWMVDNPSICMIAKRGSGKSYVCRNILKHFRNIPGGVIISPTDKMSSFYGEFFPSMYIHYEYTTILIESILHRQQVMIKKQQDKAKLGKKINPKAFLVMDDCLGSKGTWAKDQPIMEMFFNGRHYQMMYILTMQFPLGIQPELRCNFDYIFLLGEDFYSNQKRLYDHYAGMFPTFKAFRDVFVDVTDDFGCMVISNRGARKDFLDKVFWYKATTEQIDMIGSKQFNQFHEKNYNPDWNNFGSKKFKTIDYLNVKRPSYKVTKMNNPQSVNSEL
jgi:hypothetical protein